MVDIERLASRYDTDKAEHTEYLRNYAQYFEPLRGRDIRLLELGVYHGGSLLLWRDYFERGRVVGLDVEPVQMEDPTGRIRVYQGRQEDTRLLDRIARETAPEGFDIIIDDCSHIGEPTRTSFWHLFDHHLKPGGLYVVEDWGTGYWDDWTDGVGYGYGRASSSPPRTRPALYRLTRALARLQQSRAARRVPLASGLLRRAKAATLRPQFHSHDFGMVGFVKELIDELGAADITNPEHGRGPGRRSKFREMRLSPSHLFVVKS